MVYRHFHRLIRTAIDQLLLFDGKKWSQRFENLLISLREFDTIVKRGILLTYDGDSASTFIEISISYGISKAKRNFLWKGEKYGNSMEIRIFHGLNVRSPCCSVYQELVIGLLSFNVQ